MQLNCDDDDDEDDRLFSLLAVETELQGGSKFTNTSTLCIHRTIGSSPIWGSDFSIKKKKKIVSSLELF